MMFSQNSPALPSHLGWVEYTEAGTARPNDFSLEADTEAMHRWTEDMTLALNKDRGASEEGASSKHSERKVPPRLDLSRLFTRRKSSKQTTSNNPTPQHSGNDSPPRSSSLSDHVSSPPQTTPQSAAQWSFRLKKPKSQASTPALTPRAIVVGQAQVDAQSPKINVRRPRPGIQYWFDGLGEERSVMLHESSAELPASPTNTDQVASRNARSRDTFLSMSSQIDTAKSDPIQLSPQAEAMNGLVLSGMPKHRVQRSQSDFSDQLAVVHDIRPVTHRSRSTTAALQQSRRQRRKVSNKLVSTSKDCLPKSINVEQSVLILSGDDSDDQLDDPQSDIPTDVISPNSYLDPSLHEAAFVDFMVANSPKSVLGSRSGKRKGIVDIRDSTITATTIDNSSQATYMDDYSPRSTLLSEARPLSFADTLPESRPMSNVDLHEPWLASPTMSNRPPSNQPLTMSSIFPPPTDSELSQSSTSNNLTARQEAPTHHLMAVTAEEAQLLSSIRRMRAQLAANAAGRAQQHATSPLLLRPRHSKDAPASDRRSRDRSRSAGGDSANTTKRIPSPPDPPVQSAAVFPPSVTSSLSPGQQSPLSHHSSPQIPRPASNITQVWEDVQAWRKHSDPSSRPSSLRFSGVLASPRPVRPRASTSYSRNARRSLKYVSHFSPDTDSTVQTQVLSPRSVGHSIGRSNRPGLKKYSWSDGFKAPKVGSSASEGWRRSRSMDEGGSPRLDVTGDVLEAWKDLGGWRRSGISGSAVMSE